MPTASVEAVADVLQRGLDERQDALVAVRFLSLHRSSETEHRLAPRLVGRQAAADVILDEHLEVRIDFAAELGVEAPRFEQRPGTRQQREEPGTERHHRPASRSIRPITPAIRSQFCACSASCFRPARVMA
jgi:hypothetical protein